MAKFFAIANSDKSSTEEAVKEISRNIKAVSKNNPIQLCLLFFTSHYNTKLLKEILQITLRPNNILGIQSPLVFSRKKVFLKGIIACCFFSPHLQQKAFIFQGNDPGRIESSLRIFVNEHENYNPSIFSFFSCPNLWPQKIIQAISLSLGKNFSLAGSGLTKRYGRENYLINESTIQEGISTILWSNQLDSQIYQALGFIPLGKELTITKISQSRHVILEIDNKPAANIYKKYFGQQFQKLKKTGLLSSYPLGIKKDNNYTPIMILDFLEDDSILYIGNISEGEKGHIMFANPQTLLEGTEKALNYIVWPGEDNLIFACNSLLRKKILKNNIQEEIKILDKLIPKTSSLIGFYSDYNIVYNQRKKIFSIDNSSFNFICFNYKINF